jgi:hypothetical protein
MSTLSPTTQAVYDAFNRVGLYNEPSFETDRKALAAAIRAIVDELSYGSNNKSVVDKDSLLTIVDELKENEMPNDIQAVNGDFLRNFPNVTRVEVITDDGREFVRYDSSNVQVSLQDDGRTVKVFLKQEQISEEENERRFEECMEWINNLEPGDITKVMGEAFMEEFRRVSQ